MDLQALKSGDDGDNDSDKKDSDKKKAMNIKLTSFDHYSSHSVAAWETGRVKMNTFGFWSALTVPHGSSPQAPLR